MPGTGGSAAWRRAVLCWRGRRRQQQAAEPPGSKPQPCFLLWRHRGRSRRTGRHRPRPPRAHPSGCIRPCARTRLPASHAASPTPLNRGRSQGTRHPARRAGARCRTRPRPPPPRRAPTVGSRTWRGWRLRRRAAGAARGRRRCAGPGLQGRGRGAGARVVGCVLVVGVVWHAAARIRVA